MPTATDIVVIGGGAAGLTVALELQQQGWQTMRDVVVLDAEAGPGGSWRRAWDRLPARLAPDLVEPDGLADFGLSLVADVDPNAPVREAVPRAFGLFEDVSSIYVYRGARVVRVEAPRRSPLLRVDYALAGGARRSIEARLVIDATGHWSTPFVPWVPGMREFGGRQFAAARLERLGELDGARVLVVGGGRTAATLLQLLEGRAAWLDWSTRRAPDIRDVDAGGSATSDGADTNASTGGRGATATGAGTGAGASARPGASGPGVAIASHAAPGSAPGRTSSWQPPPWARHHAPDAPLRDLDHAWIPRTPEVAAAEARGLLGSRGRIRHLDARGAVFEDGTRTDVDAIVWATGSHAPLRHLAPLHLHDLRGPRGGTRVRHGWSRVDRRVGVVGDGTDSSPDEVLWHAGLIARQAVERLDLR